MFPFPRRFRSRGKMRRVPRSHVVAFFLSREVRRRLSRTCHTHTHTNTRSIKQKFRTQIESSSQAVSSSRENRIVVVFSASTRIRSALQKKTTIKKLDTIRVASTRHRHTSYHRTGLTIPTTDGTRYVIYICITLRSTYTLKSVF